MHLHLSEDQLPVSLEIHIDILRLLIQRDSLVDLVKTESYVLGGCGHRVPQVLYVGVTDRREVEVVDVIALELTAHILIARVLRLDLHFISSQL